MSGSLFPTAAKPARSNSRGLTIVWILAGLALIAGLVSLVLYLLLREKVIQGEITPTPTPIRVVGQYQPQPSVTPWPEFASLFTVSAKDLQQLLETAAEKYPDMTIAVSLRAVTEQEHIAYHEADVMLGASTTKLVTAAAVLDLVDKKRLTLTEKRAGLTISEHLRLMVNRSNNGSWEVLNNIVGLKDLQAYAKEIGLLKFTVIGNTSTAYDMAYLLQRLYRYELLSDQSTELLLSWMKQTNEETMLPAVFTQAKVVYHKYGWIDNLIHDVGIIVYNDQPFVLSIYTKGSANYASGTAVVRQMAEVVKAALKPPTEN